MPRAIHIAITQAGADFQWADYDRYPELQTHTLLGVGESTVALKEAGGGLLTEIVGVAARFVLRAGLQREDRGTVTEQSEGNEASGGLHTQYSGVVAAAKFVLRASRERERT